ncbi:LysR family transcriptional regulator [Massilia arenosa]|uniref:LysR family transcriptional regulator n=1 Tax=Zemynaea arenosa TaxID=2561931 RepID=A0A4Y9RU39_9BURK|nr:LysR family transcriptional regulator [Massilia arenosa]TFW10768.1 LysR family transcriptional regulator [Massilia arenosa]
MLDLTDVALFVRACATRNLSAAGREFGLSPAASSARLAQLEQQLGARLLHRTTRQLALTQEGDAFLPKAVALLDAAEQASDSVGDASKAPHGLLRAAASVSFGRQHIVPALAAFLGAYPGIRLDLRLSDKIIDMAANGIDVAVRIGPLRDSSVVARKLAPSRMVVCAAPSYLATHGAPRTPADLAQHECLVLGSWNPWTFHNPDGSTATVRVSGRLQSDNGEACRDAAVDGLGISLQSTWSVYQHLRAGTLVRVLADYPVELDAQISAVYLNRQYLPPKTQAFIDFFAARFGPEPYWDWPEEPRKPAK